MHPAGVAALKDEILHMAGATKERLARLTDRALTVAEEAMEATKVTRTTHKGQVFETHNDIDHNTRLAGGDRVLDIVGVKQGKGSADQGKDTRPISITYAPTYNAAPRQVEVIPS